MKKGKRALAASVICEKYKAFCESVGRPSGDVFCCESVASAMVKAEELAMAVPGSLVYVGGSTYVVSEAVGQKNRP